MVGQSLLFELFATSSRARSLLDAAMADAELRPDEYAVYSTLVDGGPSSPTMMAALVGMPATSMSRHVRTMQDRGHLERVRSQRDGRSVELRLTAAGQAVHRRAHDHFAAANLRFLGALTMDEEAARATLRAVRLAAEQATDRLAADSVGVAS